jgi:hypothetical protein
MAKNFTNRRKEDLINILTNILEITKAELPSDEHLQLNLFNSKEHLYLAIHNAIWRDDIDHFDAFYTMQFIDRFFTQRESFVEDIPF